MDQFTEFSNVAPSVKAKIGRNLHLLDNHPISIIKNHIYKYFNSFGRDFQIFDDLSPFVKIEDNFDKLLIPKDHPARSKSDTYYVNENTVLRTHTSAHQNQLLEKGLRNFLVTGDVYRKDEIDHCHYPVFHQMEGVGQIKSDTPKEDLLKVLTGLVEHLFPGCKYRVNDDYFPFTDPSFEIEVEYNGKWLEILGCGIVHKDILKNNNVEEPLWAFGLGLERLCMILFNIPDIRYFWSTHDRFLNQFKEGEIVEFKRYSLLPEIPRDISFWLVEENIVGDNWTEENDFFEIVRGIVGDWVEKVELMDKFSRTKGDKAEYSRMYRITYSPIDPELKDGNDFKMKVTEIQNKVRESVQNNLNVTLR